MQDGALKIYAEIGIGNATFCNTEIERGVLEHRIKGFLLPPKIEALYIRIWIKTRVFALSTNRGFNTTPKSKTKFKFLFGVEGKSSCA